MKLTSWFWKINFILHFLCFSDLLIIMYEKQILFFHIYFDTGRDLSFIMLQHWKTLLIYISQLWSVHCTPGVVLLVLIERKGHLSWPEGNTFSNAAEVAASLLCGKVWLMFKLVHIWIPRSLSENLPSVCVIPPQVQDFTIPLVALVNSPVCPFLQIVRISLGGCTVTPPNFVSSAILLIVYSVPPSRSLIKMLYRLNSVSVPGVNHTRSISLAIYPSCESFVLETAF